MPSRSSAYPLRPLRYLNFLRASRPERSKHQPRGPTVPVTHVFDTTVMFETWVPGTAAGHGGSTHMNVSRLLAVAVVGLALATDAGAQEGPRATVVLPTVGCRNPEDYTEAARLTKSRANDPGASAMLKDWLARHGCIGFQEGETVTVRKSAHFDNGSF